jgi:hypothetical protein
MKILLAAALLFSPLASAREVTLQWTANAPEEGITEYRILLKNEAGAFIQIASTAATQLTVKVPDAVAVVAAVAVNRLGIASPLCKPLTISAPPKPPKNFKKVGARK